MADDRPLKTPPAEKQATPPKTTDATEEARQDGFYPYPLPLNWVV